MAGPKVRLSNPRWGFGGLPGSFEVDYDFINGQLPFRSFFRLKWKCADGTTGAANLHAVFNPRGTLKIQVIPIFGFADPNQRREMEIWMEEGRFGGLMGGNGTKISNSVTLN